MACQCNGNDTCSCYITGGLKTTISGFGTSMEPFTVDVEGAFLEVEDTDTVSIGLAGTGSTPDPYFMTMDLTAVVGLAGKWAGSPYEYVHLAHREAGVLHVILGGTEWLH